MAKQNTCDSIIKDKLLQVSRVLARNSKTWLRTPCLTFFGVPGWKICVQVLKYESWPYKTPWPYETLTGQIVTSDVVINYALSKLTKRYGLISCFNVSILLMFLTNNLLIIRFVLISLHFKYRIMISGILWSDYANRCDVQKEWYQRAR